MCSMTTTETHMCACGCCHAYLALPLDLLRHARAFSDAGVAEVGNVLSQGQRILGAEVLHEVRGVGVLRKLCSGRSIVHIVQKVLCVGHGVDPTIIGASVLLG
jgi:hypothetical protein